MTAAGLWAEYAARSFEIVHPPTWRDIARPEQLPPPGAWAVWAFIAGRGAGKLLGVDTPIPTPTGWSEIGKLNVGDEVFDESGRVIRITAVYDAMPDEAWRLTFSDGSTLDACGDHQWVTWTHAERKAYLRSEHEPDTSRFPDEWPEWRSLRTSTRGLTRERFDEAVRLHASGLSLREVQRQTGVTRHVLARIMKGGGWQPKVGRVRVDSIGPQVRTTAEIVATLTQGSRGDTNHAIPVAGALQLPDAALPIDPYILGYWLGDGSSADGSFTCHPDDQPGLYAALAAAGFAPHARLRGHVNTVATTGLTIRLRKAGLLRNKHVPAAYLRASAAQRTDLLRGLMDSDGYAGRSHVEFCTTKQPLADAVSELARSLGQKPVITVARAMLYGKDCGPKFRVTWRPTIDVFRLERKRIALPPPGAQGLRHHHRMIVAAERIEPKPMRCLTVDGKHSMYLAGSAMIPTHNTRSAAEWVHERALAEPGCRIALVGRTPADVRDVMIEGESGILAVARDDEKPVYQSTKRRLTWPNGSEAHAYSAEVPSQLRGPQHHYAWCDEPASWTDARKGDVLDTAWNNLMLGLRLGKSPRCVATTTPKPVALIRTLLGRKSTVVTKGSTYDNLENLAPLFREEVLSAYEGTRIGRQELLGELLEDVEGALWTLAVLDEDRVTEAPDMRRIVVGVDPSGGDGPDNDEQGIVVAGLGVDGDLYVLADRSCKLSPHGWASRAIGALHEFAADRIIAERNYGGQMVLSTIQQVQSSVPVKVITASRGKVQRAEPVAAAYEQHRVHHVGPLPKLEDQLTTWTPHDGTSPDRLDALVWALTELTDNFGAAAWLEWARKKAEAATGAPADAEAAEPVPDGPPLVLVPAADPVTPVPADALRQARHAAYRATQGR